MTKISFTLFLAVLSLLNVAQVVEKDPYMTFNCSKSPVFYISLSPKGNVAAIGLMEYAELWDIDKQKRMAILKHEPREGGKTVNYIKFNDNGEYVCTVDYKGKRQVWDVKTGKLDKDIKTHNKWIPDPKSLRSEFEFKINNSDFDRYYVQQESKHPNSANIIAKTTKKASIEFHNTTDGAIEQEITFENLRDRQHRPPVYFDDFGSFFATGSDQGEVRFYKIASRSRY